MNLNYIKIIRYETQLIFENFQNTAYLPIFSSHGHVHISF